MFGVVGIGRAFLRDRRRRVVASRGLLVVVRGGSLLFRRFRRVF